MCTTKTLHIHRKEVGITDLHCGATVVSVFSEYIFCAHRKTIWYVEMAVPFDHHCLSARPRGHARELLSSNVSSTFHCCICNTPTACNVPCGAGTAFQACPLEWIASGMQQRAIAVYIASADRVKWIHVSSPVVSLIIHAYITAQPKQLLLQQETKRF